MMQHVTEYEYVCLYGGELFIAETPTIVRTVLGSCLAIVFYHRASGFSAICHAQLPENIRGTRKCSDSCPKPCYNEASGENPFKFVSCSIRYLVDYCARKGILLCEIDVKLFGGANILVSSPIKTVGEMNIEVAEKMLSSYRLQIVSKHVGGDKGCTLYFYSDTGEVFLRQHTPKSFPQE